MTRALACGIVALALTGCGTVQNFVDIPEDTGERTKPYGGVRIAVRDINDSHDVELTYTWPFRLADVVLSAFGDTLTLPVTLPIAGMYAIHDAIHDSIRDYYFPDKRPESGQPSEPPADRPADPMPTERVPE